MTPKPKRATASEPTVLIAFLRAINVGPNRIKMADLAAVLERAGCTAVTWHLQTGNLIFRHPASFDVQSVRAQIDEAVAGAGMKKADASIWTQPDLAAFVSVDPFADVDTATTRRLVTFFATPPPKRPLDKLSAAGFTMRSLSDAVLCHTAPIVSPTGRPLATVSDAQWGTACTTRWWNVVVDVSARADSYAAGTA